MTTSKPDNQQQRAKRYEAIHNVFFLVEEAYTIVLLAAFLFSGASEFLADAVQAVSPNPWISTALYGAVVICATKIVFLPLNWFSGYLLEHRFGLSNKKVSAWLLDETKSLGMNSVLGMIALDGLYFLLRRAGHGWWVGAGLFFLLFGMVMSVLYPVLILPLFGKLRPLSFDPALAERLTRMVESVGTKVKVLGMLRMDKSNANAAAAGLGNTKRIILSDALLSQFTPEEVEVVLAHEMAHHKYGDISKLIVWNTMMTFVGLKITDMVLRWALPKFGFVNISDLAAFPLLVLSLLLFGLICIPINNGFSRSRVYTADAFAVRRTKNLDAFVSVMKKFAAQNPASISPNPAIEWLFHDSPALDKRIAAAEKLRLEESNAVTS